MVDIKTIEENKRSFYSILSPRVVKVELTVKENNSDKKNNNTPVGAPAHKYPKKEEHNEHNHHQENKTMNTNMDEIKKAVTFIEAFLNKFLEENIKYEVRIDNYDIFVNISGEHINYLIGYRGETINSLQLLISSIANRETTEKIRVYLDIAGYKEKREKTLEELAEKIAKTVIRTGKAVTLEPMTAYERKIIHTKLQEQDKIKTFSKGEEPYRKIVVTLKD